MHVYTIKFHVNLTALLFVLYIAPSESPRNITILELASDSVLLSWISPPLHLHNGIIREYLVEITHDGSSEEVVHRTGTTSILITDLHPDFSYLVQVAGHTVEVGPFSDHLHFRTLEDGKYLTKSEYSSSVIHIYPQ